MGTRKETRKNVQKLAKTVPFSSSIVNPRLKKLFLFKKKNPQQQQKTHQLTSQAEASKLTKLIKSSLKKPGEHIPAVHKVSVVGHHQKVLDARSTLFFKKVLFHWRYKGSFLCQATAIHSTVLITLETHHRIIGHCFWIHLFLVAFQLDVDIQSFKMWRYSLLLSYKLKRNIVNARQ